MKKINNYILSIILIAFAVLHSGCKKFLDVGNPKTTLTEDNVFTDNITASNVLTSIYTGMISDGNVGGIESGQALNQYISPAADELSVIGSSVNDSRTYYENAVTQNSGITSNYVYFWASDYNAIYRVNAALVGLQNSTGVTDSVKKVLMGEAYFLRGFFYFYLVNLFGDVPLILTTDYIANGHYGRTSKDSVYQQIIADLLQAQTLLKDGYLNSDIQTTTSYRLRPNRGAATAMLARAYLYTGQYDKASAAASTLISNTGVYQLESLNNVFLTQSKEAIWQLQPINIGVNTPDGQLFILPATGPSDASYPPHRLIMSPFLLDSFYTGDLRRTNWVDSVIAGGVTYYYPYKYKVGSTYNSAVTSAGAMSEFEMVIRLGEIYLIRAEAKLQFNNDVSGCVADINAIRERAGLADYSGPTDKNSLLREILRERQVELFTEWGHRWLDLKRTGVIDQVMNVVTPAKGGTWSSYKALLPIPIADLELDVNLVQNTGY